MPALSGRCVLLVEDNYFIADELHRSLLAGGAQILGPAPQVHEALTLIDAARRIDGAVLDISLHGVMVFPVADALRARNVPFVFTTGYERSAIPDRFADVHLCEKPCDPAFVIETLIGLVI